MVDRMVGEQETNNEEAEGSPMWKFLNDEYDYKRPKRGDIRYAEVLRIGDDEIIVDIGGKTEGVVPSVDLERMGEEAVAEIGVGDKVPVYVLRPESADGDVIVSLNMARTMEDWRRAEELFEEGDAFEGKVAGYNKGGLLVYFGQIRGFIPASQLSGLSRRSSHEERMQTLSKMEGQDLLLKVIEVDRQRRRLIFSERAASREWREKRKGELLDELQEGDIRKGSVRNLCDFGAFVDLGGADGLIHISELSWRRVRHARDVLKVGEEVEVYILRVDRDRKRIGLSLKRLQPDPWHVVEEKYEIGQIVRGTITNIVDFGAFARIEDGIEGLIHVSELSDGDFAPQDLVREGEQLYLKILSIDADRQRMGLSLKQAPTREEVEGEEAWAALREETEAEIEMEAEVEAQAEEYEEPVAEVAEPELKTELGLEEAAVEFEEPEAELEPEQYEEPAVEVTEPELEAELEVEEAAVEFEEPEAEVEPEEYEEPAVEVAEPELEAELEVEEAPVEPEELEAEVEPEQYEEPAVEVTEPELEAELEAEEAPVDFEEPEAEVEPEEYEEPAVEVTEPELEAELEVEEATADFEEPEAEAPAGELEKDQMEIAEEPSEEEDEPGLAEEMETEPEESPGVGAEQDEEDEE